MRNGRHTTGQIDQHQFGALIAARLSEGTDDLPHDISERLRAARVRAVGTRRVSPVKAVLYTSASNASLVMGSERLGGWGRLAATAPLVALVFGLVFISMVQDDNQASELAEIDSAILTDDLPPSAYTDPGFSVFLKNEIRKNQ